MFKLNVHEIVAKSKQALENINEKPTFTQTVFSESDFKDKLKADMVFMEYLVENYLGKDKYPLVESIYKNLGRIAQEIDTNIPTNYKKKILQTTELTENEILDNYKSQLEFHVNQRYTKKILTNELLESHHDGIKSLTEVLVENEIIGNVDLELITKYAIFEAELLNGIRNIIMPELFQEALDYKLKTTEEDYFAIFDNNFKTNSEMLESNLYDLVIDSGLALTMFNESISEEGVQVSEHYKGVSKLLNYK